MGQYPDSGALFAEQDKKTDRSPDYTGAVEISKELAEYIMNEIDNNGEASVRVAGWKRDGKRGSFLSLKVSAPKKPSKPAPKTTAKTAPSIPDLDDEIPF